MKTILKNNLARTILKEFSSQNKDKHFAVLLSGCGVYDGRYIYGKT
jgi:hypothetical protein